MPFRGTHPTPLGIPVAEYRRPCTVALLFLLAFLPAAGALANGAALEAIEAAQDHIETLLSAAEESPDRRRDGLYFRIDDRAHQLGTLILNYPLGAAEGNPAEELAPHLQWYHDLLVERYQRLQERITQERQRFDEFDSSAQAAISRAFQEDLRKVSARYADLMVQLLAFAEEIGIADEGIRAETDESLILGAESLSGQVLLDSMTLKELRAMRRADPANEELKNAEAAVQRKQVRSLDYLEQIVRLMEASSLGVADYRALLLAERGTIGVEILRRDVFMNLLASRIGKTRDAMLAAGPNFVFRTLVFLSLVAFAWFAARLVQALVRSLVHRES